MSGYRENDRAPWHRTGPARRSLKLLLSFAAVFLAASFLQELTTEERAVEIVATLWIFGTLIAVLSAHRGELWFWLTMTVMAVIHALIISFVRVDFPKGPALSYIYPVMMIDGFVMYGLLKLLASRLSSTTEPSQIL